VLEGEHQEVEKAKNKYQKAYTDWQEAVRNFERADQDGTLSRNEILKMKIVTDMKSRSHEDSRSRYLGQIGKTNLASREQHGRVMPGLLDQLQVIVIIVIIVIIIIIVIIVIIIIIIIVMVDPQIPHMTDSPNWGLCLMGNVLRHIPQLI
jgi:hypothetical protein